MPSHLRRHQQHAGTGPDPPAGHRDPRAASSAAYAAERVVKGYASFFAAPVDCQPPTIVARGAFARSLTVDGIACGCFQPQEVSQAMSYRDFVVFLSNVLPIVFGIAIAAI